MKVRPDVAELLHAGLPDRTIARQLHVDHKAVAAARAALGLPKTKTGRKAAASPEDLFRERATPTADGHMEWTGYRTKDGVPGLRHGGTFYTAYRLAYRMATGRAPEGYALPSCGRDHCVKPGHHSDRADREREQHVDALYVGIFGQQPERGAR